jgi:hypothetical protein
MSEYNELRRALLNLKLKFERQKARYGDMRIPTPDVGTLPIGEQFKFFQSSLDELEAAYSDRTTEVHKAYDELSTLYKQLGYTKADQGEFADEDRLDLTASKLVKLRKEISTLHAEQSRRDAVHGTLKDLYTRLIEETKEQVPPQLKTLLSSPSTGGQSFRQLETAVEELKALKGQREFHIHRIQSEITTLYQTLAVDVRDRMTFSAAPTAQNLKELQAELDFIESEKPARLPTVVSVYEREVDRLCDDLHIPSYKRPHYRGADSMAAISFYASSIEDLKSLSAERTHIQELAAQAENDVYGASEELEAAVENFKKRTGSDVELSPRSPGTKTELALTSSFTQDTPSKRSNRKPLAGATDDNLAASAKQLFGRPKTPQSARKTYGAPPRMRRLSPEQRHAHDISLRARNPFRLPLY